MQYRETTPVRTRLSKIPTPLGGLALGIASLGALWGSVTPDYQTVLQLASATAAFSLIVALLLKFIANPSLLLKDLAHPVTGSVLPTCTMAMMVISQSFLEVMPALARELWLIAVICHLTLLTGFIAHRLKGFELQQMVPSWFVPPVGIIVAAVTSSGMGYDELVKALFIFGLGAYFIELPIMLYRLIFKGVIPTPALPTFAIMAAPASLSLAGYLTITSAPDYLLIAILTPLALFMTGLVYIAFIRLLRLPFSPGYAAFTFPMVIGSTALTKLAATLYLDGYTRAHDVIAHAAYIERYIATFIVFYVAVRFIGHYLPSRVQQAGAVQASS